jgi:uncharacterized protein (TIGR02145 family)
MAAKDYKVFDGTSWVSPCDQEIRILMPDGVTWKLLDPTNEDVKYFDGAAWKPMLCIDPPPPATPINCTQGSLSGSGSSGIYYIPMTVEANVCDVAITLNVASVPDSLAILSADKSTVLIQTGYFGSGANPTPGNYNYGLFKPRKIYTYDPTTPTNFSINPLAPNETLTVLPNQFPITDTNPLNIPNAKNPADQFQTVRTITWTKGVTPTDVNILIRVVGHPDSGTVWTISAIACANCAPPIPPDPPPLPPPPPPPPPPGPGPCADCVQGLVTIGSQIWAKCNANVKTYRNGNPIPYEPNPTNWSGIDVGAWCYYDNDPSTEATYGLLYNWHAVNDPRGLAPAGYHVPSDTEWTTLTTTLGGGSVAGGKLKEAGLCHWITPNTSATNSSLFTALPGGARYYLGSYVNQGYNGYWWTSTEEDVNAWFRALSNGGGNIERNTDFKNEGKSVRFIKD